MSRRPRSTVLLGAGSTGHADFSALEGSGAPEIPEEVLRAIRGAARPSRSKYGNRVCYADGLRFASERERARYFVLKTREQEGAIYNLRLQTRWPLLVNGVTVADYVDDFNYMPVLDGAPPGPVTLGEIVVEDTKGVRTAVYRLKAKLMLACHGIRVQEV